MVSVHEEKKAVQSDICNYSLSQKANLKRHIETVHEGRKSF